MTPVHPRIGPARRHMPVLLVVAAAMAVAAHLGFFALALTHWHWTLSATGVVALLLLAKILAAIVGHRRARRKRRRHE
jgi:hypothetical protein